VVVEDWRALRLAIQVPVAKCSSRSRRFMDLLQRDNVHTIKDALLNISSPQSVSLTSPTRPGVAIEASQQVLIDALPPILVVHMKRFLYDTSGVGGVVKVGKQIPFVEELEVAGGV
jgi:ubiquitin carboxyl-terminal hydrolase 10